MGESLLNMNENAKTCLNAIQNDIEFQSWYLTLETASD